MSLGFNFTLPSKRFASSLSSCPAAAAAAFYCCLLSLPYFSFSPWSLPSDHVMQGKIQLDIDKLLSRKASSTPNESNTSSRMTSNSAVPCWAFATFDGHAGPACAQYLKDNFLVSGIAMAGGGWRAWMSSEFFGSSFFVFRLSLS